MTADQDFLVTVNGINRGAVARQCTEALTQVVAAVLDQRADGAMTLKLAVKPRKGSEDQVDVVASVTSSPPVEKHTDRFFVGADNQLLRDDPEAVAMFSRDEVAGGR